MGINISKLLCVICNRACRHLANPPNSVCATVWTNKGCGVFEIWTQIFPCWCVVGGLAMLQRPTTVFCVTYLAKLSEAFLLCASSGQEKYDGDETHNRANVASGVPGVCPSRFHHGIVLNADGRQVERNQDWGEVVENTVWIPKVADLWRRSGGRTKLRGAGFSRDAIPLSAGLGRGAPDSGRTRNVQPRAFREIFWAHGIEPCAGGPAVC